MKKKAIQIKHAFTRYQYLNPNDQTTDLSTFENWLKNQRLIEVKDEEFEKFVNSNELSKININAGSVVNDIKPQRLTLSNDKEADDKESDDDIKSLSPAEPKRSNYKSTTALIAPIKKISNTTNVAATYLMNASVKVVQFAAHDDKSESVHRTVSSLIPSGLKYQQVPGDGHCLYTAVGLYLGQTQEFLRNIVVANIEHSMGQYHDIIEALNPGKTPKEYLERLRRGLEWADNLEIAILMKVLDRPIVVVGLDGNVRNLPDLTGAGDPIFVQFNGHNHYDALILTGEKEPREIFKTMTQLNEYSHKGEHIVSVNMPKDNSKVDCFYRYYDFIHREAQILDEKHKEYQDKYKHANVEDQISLKMEMANTFYFYGNFLDAQLLALSAIRLILANNLDVKPPVKRDDLQKAKEFYKLQIGFIELESPYMIVKADRAIVKAECAGKTKYQKNLNKIINDALEHYANEKHDDFIRVLSTNYKTMQNIEGSGLNRDKSLIRHDMAYINSDRIIRILLKYKFRPDGIAYILSLIAETLLSGKIALKSLGVQKDQEYMARQILLDISSHEVLKQKAEEYDEIIHNSLKEHLKLKGRKVNSLTEELRRISSNGFAGGDEFSANVNKINALVNRNKDLRQWFAEFRTGSKVLDEIDCMDAQQMSFIARLEAVCNVARINLFIIKTLDKEQKETCNVYIRQAMDSNAKYFKGYSDAMIRQEILEEFAKELSGDVNLIAKKQNDVQDRNHVLQHSVIVHGQAKEHYDKAVNSETLAKKELGHSTSLEHWLNARRGYAEALKTLGLPNNKEDYINASLGLIRCMVKLSEYCETLRFLGEDSHMAELPGYWRYASIAYDKLRKHDLAKLCAIEALKLNHHDKDATEQLTSVNKTIKTNIKSEELLTIYKNSRDQIVQDEWHFNSRHKVDTAPSYNILSIDGGGIRGIIPALWISELEHRTRKPMSHLFNMIAGTSTGAIIAAGLVTPDNASTYKPRYSAYDILELYAYERKDIFTKPMWNISMAQKIGNLTYKPKYTGDGRFNMFKKYFEDTTLANSLTELVIPAVDGDNLSKTHLFNRYNSRYNNDNIKMVDALMATSAAPAFFPAYKIAGKGTFFDGGVHLNNPSQTAYYEAIKYKVPEEKIFVLSMGTGSYMPDPFRPAAHEGLLFWGANLHKIAFSAQEGNVDSQMQHQLGNRYQRWQVLLEEPVALDAQSDEEIDALVQVGKQYLEDMYSSDENIMNKLIERFDNMEHRTIADRASSSTSLNSGVAFTPYQNSRNQAGMTVTNNITNKPVAVERPIRQQKNNDEQGGGINIKALKKIFKG